MIAASLAIFLSWQSIGVIDTTHCTDNIRLLAESGAPLTEVYRETLPSMKLSELRQMRDHPLQLPLPEDLTTISSSLPILQMILPLMHREPGLGQRLREMIDNELTSRENSTNVFRNNATQTKKFETDRIMQGHNMMASRLAISPDGSRLYSTSRFSNDMNLRIWDTTEGIEINRIPNSLSKFVVDHISQTIFTISLGSEICAFDAATGQARAYEDGRDLRASFGNSHAIAKRQGGKIIFVGEGPHIYILNASTLVAYREKKSQNMIKFPGTQRLDLDDDVKSLAASNDGKYLYAGYDKAASIRRWKINAEALNLGKPEYDQIVTHEMFVNNEQNMGELVLSPDNKILVSISANGRRTIRLWNTETLQPITNEDKSPVTLDFNQSGDTIPPIAFSPNGKVLFYRGKKGIHFWDLKKQKPIKNGTTNEDLVITQPGGIVGGIAIHPNGEIIFFGQHNGNIRSAVLMDYLPEEYFEETP